MAQFHQVFQLVTRRELISNLCKVTCSFVLFIGDEMQNEENKGRREKTLALQAH